MNPATWIEGIGPPLEQLEKDYSTEPDLYQGEIDFLALAKAYRKLEAKHLQMRETLLEIRDWNDSVEAEDCPTLRGLARVALEDDELESL